MQNTLPIDFQHRMQYQLGDAYGAFLTALAGKAPVSIRQNPQKNYDAQANIKQGKIPWDAHAYYLSERPVFTLDPAFHAGAYYVQEASSMLISHALRQKVDMQKTLRILDLCAAPGGKSTLMASLMSEKSLLVCNEVIKSRVAILKENINKWGLPNVVVSNHEVTEMGVLEHFFDVILIDAPCSGEGLFRKDEHARKEWSPDNVQLCAARQKKIVANAVPLLREGGILLYSTCTYNDDENIGNVQWITEQFGLISQAVDFLEEWGIATINIGDAFGYQCFPHRVEGEGFFLSVLVKDKHDFSKNFGNHFSNTKSLEALSKKDAERLTPWLRSDIELAFFRKGNGTIVAIPKSILSVCDEVTLALRRSSYGVELGEFKGKDFIPSHELAMSTLISADCQAVELTLQESLLFLKKELQQVEGGMRGWTLARYQGLNLGWMKILPNRINNYLPAHFRIRMDIEE